MDVHVLKSICTAQIKLIRQFYNGGHKYWCLGKVQMDMGIARKGPEYIQNTLNKIPKDNKKQCFSKVTVY